MDPGSVERTGTVSRVKRVWTRNKRIRLLLTMELAVMVPAAALIFLNYHQLKSIERDKALEAAIHRDFQQMLAIAEKQINQKAYATVEAARERFPSPDADKAEKIHQLDAVLAGQAALAHVFLFDADGEMVRSRAERMDDPHFVKEHERLQTTYGGWFALESKTILEGIRKRSRQVMWSSDRAKRPGGVAYMPIALFTLPGASPERTVVGGVAIEPDYLKRALLPQMLDGIIAYKLGEEGGNPLAMAVFVAGEGDAGWPTLEPGLEPMAASAGWTHGAPEVTRNLDEVFRGLRLGIKFRGTTVEAIGRGWVRNSLIALGILSLLLVGGLVLGGLLLALGDVCGKGLAAGMWTPCLVGLVRAHAAVSSEPGAIVTGVNREFYRMHAPLTSLFMARLDPATGTLAYCSAGHPPPLLLRGNGQSESLSEGGMLLGMSADASFRGGRLEFGAGDVLLAYSDGVVESRNGSDEEFGVDGLEAHLRHARSESAEAVLFSILAAVQDFAAPHALADDTSLVVIRQRVDA